MRAWKAVLEGPSWDVLRQIDCRQTKHSAEVVRDCVLDGQVLFELVVVLDDFVAPPLQVVDERTRAFGQQRLAVALAEEV